MRGFTQKKFVANFQKAFNDLAREIQGTNEDIPTIILRSALTYVRQVLEWSGRNMEPQFKEARIWKEVEQQRIAQRYPEGYSYDGWE
jgi:hypothetical protein